MGRISNPIPLPFANGFYESDSLPLSAQECVNLYPVIPEEPSLNQAVLFGTPGLDQLATSGSLAADNSRGAHSMNGVPYFVNGGTLYRLESDLVTLTSLGTIAGTGRVSMADNGTQLMIIDTGSTDFYYASALAFGPNAYIFTASPDTLTQITDSDFIANGDPQHVVFIDAYFVCSTNSKKFILSAINNGLAYNGADFGTAEADPDDIVIPAVLNNQLYMVGSQSMEQFANTGDNNFPFQRTGLFTEKGCLAAFSMVKLNSGLYFVGLGEDEGAAIWEYGGGGQPTKISTEPVESVLERLTEAEQMAIFSYAYGQKGEFFVCFALPTTTLVYNIKNQKWHERKSDIILPGDAERTKTRFRVNSLTTAYGKVLVGDSQDGRVGSMDIDIYTEYTDFIMRRTAGQPFQNSMNPFRIPWLEAVMESGVGNTDTPDPKISMTRSLDGKTYTEPLDRSFGMMGKYSKRAVWTKLGQANRFEVFAFEVSAKVKVVLLSVVADMRP